LELRVPFVDIKVFRHICSLRAAGKNISKLQFFKSLGQDLPNTIATRSKTGFSVPVNKWKTNISKNHEKKYRNSSRSWAEEVIKNFHI
jgi:hypothetical protein